MKIKYYKLIISATIFISSFFVWYILSISSSSGKLEIYFLKLNRGHAVFIRTPKNENILINGGQNSEIIKELTRILPFYERRIDILIMTSAEHRNVGGLVDIIKRYEVKKIIEPILLATSTALYVFEDVLRNKNISVEKVGKGDTFFTKEFKFHVLFPDLDFKYNKTSRKEMVLLMEYGSTTMLLLGNVSKTIQKSFITEPLFHSTKIDIVEYDHSAINSNTSEELFSKLNPEYVIIRRNLKSKANSFLIEGKIEGEMNTKILNLEKEG